jgi:hypothetical protein
MAFGPKKLIGSYGGVSAPPPTAIVQWLMGAGDYGGNNLTDSSGNGNLGDLVGSPTWSTSSPPGGAYSYLEFNGSSQYAYSDSAVGFPSSSIITIDMWAYSTNWSGKASYLISEPSFNGGFLLYVPAGPSKLYAYMGDLTGSLSLYISSSSLSNSAWHHIQVVLNNSNGTIQMYVDSGGDVATFSGSTWSTATTFSSQVLTLGYRSSYFNGNMALFQIFSGDTHTL